MADDKWDDGDGTASPDPAEEIAEHYARLHWAGWSVGSTAVMAADGTRRWMVTGVNGENLIRAEGWTEVEAWREAVGQAGAVGMLGASDTPRLKPGACS